ncbi:anti-phage protein KwaA [Methanolobus sp. WCC1]|uniref:anti-phage protein KwaA n=1 Tax=unclassified Methanolobus TaxID=2629569 RepID=UPI003254221F
MSKHIESIHIWDKVKLYITSLWLLFFLLIVLTIDVPITFSKNYEFIGFEELISRNYIPLISFLFLIIGIFYCLCFDYKFKGTAPLQINVQTVENVNYEHITFLTTYIIPLLSFDISNIRYLLLLFLLLIIICAIYIRTNLFYANPTLALLGYHIYKITGYRIKEQNTDSYENIIVIAKTNILLNDEIQLIFLSDNIYFGRKV